MKTMTSQPIKQEIPLKTLIQENRRLKRENSVLKEKCLAYRKKYKWYQTLFDFGADPLIVHTYQHAPDTEESNWMEMVNKRQKVVEVNKAFTKSMGYTKKQSIGLSVYDIDNTIFRSPKQTHEAYKYFTPHPSNKVLSIERIHHDITGRYFPVELKIRFLTIDNTQYVMTLCRDISDRKQLEAEMQRSYLSEKRHAANLQKEINTRIEFTRSLVHELKTPLTPILASSEALVKMEPAKTLKGELARNIHRGACGLNIRINELLDLAKLEISELTLRKSTVLPGRLIEEIVAEMNQQIIARGQSIKLNITAGLPPICADPERLKQILRNLLDNAVKYNRDNGQIFLEARTEGGFIKVGVRDQGKGITKKNQKHLFQPYFRCEEDRDKFDGLGLGLCLSKSLVELHNGKIELQSTRCKGTTVSFGLPLTGKEKV